MNTTPTTHRIQKIHFWTPELVKNFCVDLGAYTCGCNAEYDEMLEYVTYHDPEEPQNVYIVARDILEHSSDELNANFLVDDIMELLEMTAIRTNYIVD